LRRDAEFTFLQAVLDVLNGLHWAWESTKVMWRQGLDAGDVSIILQAVPKAVPDLPKVPMAIDFAKSGEARKLIEVGIHDTAAITCPYALAPGRPRTVFKFCTELLSKRWKTRIFWLRQRRRNLTLVEKIVSGLFKLDSATIAKMSEILR
jgi:hypothetical protein